MYVLRCGDGSLYTGITNDLWRRVEAHARGKGARYTRGRGPLEVRFWESGHSKGGALVLERKLKALSRAQKLRVCALTST